MVDVCTNLSCSLRGAEDLLAYLEAKLGLKAGTSNEKWTLRETECLASCGTAPCLQVDEVHHEGLTPGARGRPVRQAVLKKTVPKTTLQQ